MQLILRRIQKFNECRTKSVWFSPEINIFARSLAQLFSKEDLQAMCRKFYDVELKKNAKKADLITELIRTPLWLEWDEEGQKTQIVFDITKYPGINPITYTSSVSN